MTRRPWASSVANVASHQLRFIRRSFASSAAHFFACVGLLRGLTGREELEAEVTLSDNVGRTDGTANFFFFSSGAMEGVGVGANFFVCSSGFMSGVLRLREDAKVPFTEKEQRTPPKKKERKEGKGERGGGSKTGRGEQDSPQRGVRCSSGTSIISAALVSRSQMRACSFCNSHSSRPNLDISPQTKDLRADRYCSSETGESMGRFAVSRVKGTFGATASSREPKSMSRLGRELCVHSGNLSVISRGVLWKIPHRRDCKLQAGTWEQESQQEAVFCLRNKQKWPHKNAAPSLKFLLFHLEILGLITLWTSRLLVAPPSPHPPMLRMLRCGVRCRVYVWSVGSCLRLHVVLPSFFACLLALVFSS